MQVTYRLLVIAVAGIGIAVGISFGLGVAYGKGDSETTSSGLTAEQIAAIVGGGGGATRPGGTTQGSGTPTAGTTPAAGSTPAAAPPGTTGGTTMGQISEINADSITVQTTQGDVVVKLDASTTVEALTSGTVSDLEVGDFVVAGGNPAEDGSVTASSVSEVPSALQGLLSGGLRGGGQQQQAPAQATPTP